MVEAGINWPTVPVFQILVFAAESRPVAAEFHAEHHQLALPSLPLHSHLRLTWDAALRWRVSSDYVRRRTCKKVLDSIKKNNNNNCFFLSDSTSLKEDRLKILIHLLKLFSQYFKWVWKPEQTQWSSCQEWGRPRSVATTLFSKAAKRSHNESFIRSSLPYTPILI